MTESICIFGSRDVDIYQCRDQVFNFVSSTSLNTIIIEGEASGVDTEARRAAQFYRRIFKSYPANWKALGKKAGFVRNIEMESISTSGFCVYNGESTGSKHTISLFNKSKKQLIIVQIDKSFVKYRVSI